MTDHSSISKEVIEGCYFTSGAHCTVKVAWICFEWLNLSNATAVCTSVPIVLKVIIPSVTAEKMLFLSTCSKRLLLVVARAWFVHVFVCLLGDDVHLERLYSHWQTQRLNWRHAENTGWGTGSTWKSTKYVNPLSTFTKTILIEINAILQKLIQTY